MSTPLNGRVTSMRGKGNNSASSASASGGSVSVAGGAGGGSVGNAASGSYGLSRRAGNNTANFANTLAGFETRLSLLEMGARAGQISFTSMLDGNMKAYDLLGELKMKLGKQTDGKWGVTYATGTAPPKPSDPLVSARQLGFVVGWDGTFAGGFDRPTDLSRVDVHVSTEGPDFVPVQGTAFGSIFAEGATPVFGNIQDYWVKLVAVSLADVPSPPSAAVAVRPFPATALAAETISGIHFAGEIFMGSTFVAGRPDKAHIEFNPSGIALYREDQTPTVVFSTDEGNALITGSIQTALKASGKSRIVFNPFPELDWNEIRLFAPGDVKWASIFASRDARGANGALTLQGFLDQDSTLATILTLGEDSLVLGIATKTKTATNTAGYPINDGLAISPEQVILQGVSGPFICSNYNRDTTGSQSLLYQDPVFVWANRTASAVNPMSALEVAEVRRGLGVNATDAPAFRNSFNDTSIVFGGGYYPGVYCFNYDFTAYTPIYASNVQGPTSSRAVKEEIEPMPLSGLGVVRTVEPMQFRRKPVTPRSLTIYQPDVSPAPDEEVTEELRLARKRRRADGKIPVGRRPKSATNPLQYGMIAEDIEQVAPIAIVDGPGGHKLINDTSLDAILWGAVRELDDIVANLRSKVDQMEAGS